MALWHSLLACPNCGGVLSERSGAIACDNGHAFDIARQGYVNLLSGGAHTGTADTPAMVAARAAFLARGHLSAIDQAVGDLVSESIAGVAGCILDVGAGTGEHLAAVLDHMPDRIGLALDLSKHAAQRAARAHERISAVVCDAWGRLPVRDGAAAAVMSVFAPRNAAEFARVLAPGGMLVVVAPTVVHLAELVAALGMVSVDPRKEERLEAALGSRFRRVGSTLVEHELSLSHDDALAAAMMGPSAHHLSAPEAERRVSRLGEPFATVLSVTVSTWEPLGGMTDER